jgi:Protein of unknown function DUF131.
MVDLYLLFIIPFIVIIVGIILIFLSIFRSLEKKKDEEEGKKEAGAFILIGPIPIVISSSKRLGYIMVIAGIILTVLAILLFLLSQGIIV